MKLKTKNPQSGGAALEYILVSTFAAALAIAAAGLVGTLVRDKLTGMAERFGLEGEIDLDLPFLTKE